MTAYMIFTRERTRDLASLKRYSERARGSFAGHDVKATVVNGRFEVLEGAAAEGVAMLTFPTMDAAKAWYESADYKEARELRFKGADYRCILVEGV